MIKFRYKRKETTNAGSNASNSNASTKMNSNKSVEIKSNEMNKDDNKPKLSALKCEVNDAPLKQIMTKIDTVNGVQTIKPKTSSDQEYMEDCIRAIVVSRIIFCFV